ncbi:MAG: opacity protein-like surface antigen [Oleispira sp.]|jgi:opacity protein-like surface antigen
MIKPISAATLLSLTVISLNTQAKVEPGIFIGLDLSTSITGTAKAESEVSDTENETDIDANALSFYIGYRFPTNNRFQISLTSIDVSYDSGSDQEFNGTDFDWQFVYGTDKLQPYWGLGFGIYTYEDTAKITEKNDDLSGVSLQLLGGIKFDVHEHVEFDVSYRVKSIAWQDITVSNGFSTETISLSHTTSSLNFGAAFKF